MAGQKKPLAHEKSILEMAIIRIVSSTSVVLPNRKEIFWNSTAPTYF